MRSIVQCRMQFPVLDIPRSSPRPGKSSRKLLWSTPLHISIPNRARRRVRVSTVCYSARVGHVWPLSCSRPRLHEGRGPPRRLRRPELQAMSNSLQLTSI